ncbi:hypothetical protein M976_00253 [Buttiauxella ferragutiae ATCC 51602]|uniref:Uncharacterized protein n=1 Tax=Buttiauxella ferragutiae ATCC 51602 TaxID=1354252 RepID=A0ABX2WEE6_9ENTR|nr:hypothetical protein [Buttiauxella ferragutiae]OAT33505.1 hypothetical protein M976_00253 [Buttiauxella ferragutiae ATCC 51602]
MKQTSLLLLLAPCAYVYAGLIPVASEYAEVEPGVGRAVSVNGYMDVPDKYLDQVGRETNYNFLWYVVSNSPTCSNVGETLTTNSATTDFLSRANYGATLRELIQDGSYPLATNMSYYKWSPSGDTIYQKVSVYRYNGTTSYDHLLIGACLPVAVTTTASCALVEGNVLLDHGTVSTEGTSTASAMITVSCSSKGSGHLSLSTGSDTLPVGTGESVISTDAGALSTRRPFAKGNTPIELISTLSGVGVGKWEASSVLVLEMD